MKLIVQKLPKYNYLRIWKEIARCTLIILNYLIGISIYTLLFLLPAYYIANVPFIEISPHWFILIFVSIIASIIHIHYWYTGSLKSRSLVMFILFLLIFVIPITILIII